MNSSMEMKYAIQETISMDNEREPPRWNITRTDIKENKEDLTLVWLDECITGSDDFLQIFEKIRELNDYILLYTDPQLFLDYVISVTNEKILLIISHNVSHTVLSAVQSMPTVISVCLYGTSDSKAATKLQKDLSGTVVCKDQNSLIETIEKTVSLFSKQTVTLSLFGDTKESSFRDFALNPASFLWFKLLLDVFKQLPHSTDAKKQMIEACEKNYRSNSSYLKQVKDFNDAYKASEAVLWYTKSGFIYRLMNKAFRVDDMYILYLLRFYIIDLYEQIELESRKLSEASAMITLYRGRPIREEELEILKANIGRLVSPNGFFSTTRDYDVALKFAGDDNDRTVRTLFSITVHLTDVANGTILVADIEKLSNFPQEKEVLFNVGSTFKIDNVTYNDELRIWFVEMTATNSKLPYVQEHIDLARKDLMETNPTRLFGKLLIDMGQYLKAEQYYNLVLRTVNEDHSDFPSLYHGFGYTNYVQDRYADALKYDEFAYNKRKQMLSEDHLDIARSSLNLGCDYVKYGNLKRGRELLMEALRIRKLRYREEDNANIAIVLREIGDSYTRSHEYDTAWGYLKSALEMFKRVSTSETAEIVGTLTKFGYWYEEQGQYDFAMKYYRETHEMASKLLLPEHPRLQRYFKNIIILYQKMNRINEAVQFCNEKLSSQRKLLGEQHPNVAQIFEVLGDLIADNAQKLFNYRQALNIWKKYYPNNTQDIVICKSKIDAISDFNTQ